MKRIYIAGPFSGKTGWDVARNVHRAASFILPIAEAGACPVCPHTMTAMFDGTLDWQRWIEITRCLQETCDAALYTPTWEESSGARIEREWSEQNGQPAFTAREFGAVPDEFLRWLETR